MNAIFVKVEDRIIMATVIYEPLSGKHQLILDRLLYKEFDSTEEKQALQYMKDLFPLEDVIKPDVTLLISNDCPLSSQCSKITGDSYNLSTFEDLCGVDLIKHRESGLIFRVLNVNALRMQYNDYCYCKKGTEYFKRAFKALPATLPERDLSLKSGRFRY